MIQHTNVYIGGNALTLQRYFHEGLRGQVMFDSPCHHSIVQPIAADGGQSAHMEGCCNKQLTRGGPLAWGLGEKLTTPQHTYRHITECYPWGPQLHTDPLAPENYIMRSFMYSSPNIFRITKSRSMSWASHVARMGVREMHSRFRRGNPEERVLLEDLRCRR